MTYKIGDKVRIKEACTVHEAGTVLTLSSDFAGDLSTGSCDVPDHWELVDDHPLAVGDLIVGDNDWEFKILEVLENTFLPSKYNDFETAADWRTWEYAQAHLKSGDWKLKSPSEEVILSMEEVAKLAKCDVKDLKIKKD